MSSFKKILASAFSTTLVVVGSLAFSLGIQALLLSPARSDAGIPLTADPEERAAVQAEIDACGKDTALFLKRLDLHAASAKAAYTDALKDMNPIVRRAAAAYCFETEQEILVRTTCYARALDQMESDVAKLLQLRTQASTTGAVLLDSLVKKNHFAGKVLYQQCTPSGGAPTDACMDLNLAALREQLVDAYNEMSASFDEMSRWSVISAACNSSLGGAPCRAVYAARVKEAQGRIEEGRKKNPKAFVYNASQADFFAPVPASVAYDPIYVLPGLTGKFQGPDRMDTITAGRSYHSGSRKPLLPGKGPKKHVKKPGSKTQGAKVVEFGVPAPTKKSVKPGAKPGSAVDPALAKKPANKPDPKLAPKQTPKTAKKPGQTPAPHRPAAPGAKPAVPKPSTKPSPSTPPATEPPKNPDGTKPTPDQTPEPAPSSTPAAPANPSVPGDAPKSPGGAPGGQGDQPGGNATGNVANRDHATNLDCAEEAQALYRTEARLGWSKASFSEMYPRRMLGQSKLYACYVKEFYAHNDQAVMLANAAMAISAAAKVVLPVQSAPSIAGARRACTEAQSLIQWMDASLTTLEQSHPRAEIAPLRAEVGALTGQDCMPLVAKISDDEFSKKLNDEFCAWKSAVENEEPRSTLGFPSSIAKCAP